MDGQPLKPYKSRVGKLNSRSGQINCSNFRIHTFPALRSALNGQYGEQVGKISCHLGKTMTEFSHVGVID